MLTSSVTSDPIALLTLSGGAALLGLVLLLTGRSSHRPRSLALGLAGLLPVGFAIGTPLLGGPPVLRWPLLGLGVVWAACTLLSSDYPSRMMALAGRPRVQGAALLVAGPLLALGWCWHAEQDAARAAQTENLVPDGPMPGGHDDAMYTAWTDRGSAVLVHDVAPHLTLPADVAVEARLIKSRGLEARLIRTGGPDRATNCHGWVFTGGRYWVDGSDVERVLDDNGYKPVVAPYPGDVAIYRDDRGALVHTAVVRTVTDAGLILLESKWSHLGRFVHAPEDYAFPAASCGYYRSPRAGHLLRGLEGEPSRTALSAGPGQAIAAPGTALTDNASPRLRQSP